MIIQHVKTEIMQNTRKLLVITVWHFFKIFSFRNDFERIGGMICYYSKYSFSIEKGQRIAFENHLQWF